MANYSKCLDRKLFSVELAKSEFPEALIDFYVTASPVVGNGRSNTVRADGKRGGIAGDSHVVQSTRNGASFNFNDSLQE